MSAPGESTAPHYSAQPLRALAAGVAKGDELAAEALHKRLSPGLRKLLMQRANQRHDVVEDIIQRTWLAVWLALREGRYDESKSAITTFVYAVGHKVWLQHLRRQGRAIESSGAPEGVFDSAPEESAAADPAAAAPLAELLEAVRECLHDPESGLTEDERWLVCEAAAGASDRDLARKLQLAASTINARKRAAIDKIRRYLAQRGHRDLLAERGGPIRQ